MKVSPDKFMRFVLPWAPGAADIAVARYVVDAAHEFCMRTGVWREDLDVESVRKGVAEVDLPLPADAVLVEVKEVYFQGRKVDPVPPDSAARVLGSNWEVITGSSPKAYLNPTPEMIRLVPIPDESIRSCLKIKVSLAPSFDATELPKILYDRYAQAIAYGALSKLLLEQGRSYSNDAKARDYYSLFNEEKSKARREAQEGFNRARYRTRSYHF